MKLKTFLTINAVVAMLSGLAFALEWFYLAEPLVSDGSALPPDIGPNTPMMLWLLGSFVRMFGMALFGLGALTFAVRDASEKALRRKILIALLLAWFFTALIALAQQIAIWNTPTGWLLVLFCAVMAGGYATYFVKDVLEEWRPRPQMFSIEDQNYNLALIRYVTQNYNSLQGLRMVPFGLFYLASAAGWLGKQGDCTFSIPALVLAILLYFGLGAYYRQRFGRVHHAPVNLGPIRLAVESPVWFVVGLGAFLVFWAISALDYFLRPPVSLLGLSLAAGLAAVWLLPTFRPRVHYLVMAILVTGISLLPLAGFSSGNEILAPVEGTLLYIVLGSIFVVGGLMDHLILVRVLKPLPEDASHE